MKLLWKLGYKNLLRNGRRNLITGSSITLGMVGVALLGGYILRMERYLATQSVYLNFNGHVIVYQHDGLDKHLSNPGNYSIDEKSQNFLKKISQDPRVEKTSAIIKGSGLIHNGCNSMPFFSTAVSPEIAEWTRDHPQVIRYISELGKMSKGAGFWKINPAENPINITGRLANFLKKNKVLNEKDATNNSSLVLDCTDSNTRNLVSMDPSIQLIGQGFEGGMALTDGSIAGLFTTGMAFADDGAILMSLAQAQRFYNTEKITAFSYFLKSESDIPAFIRDLQSFTDKEGLKLDIYPFSDERISAFYVGGMNFNWVMLILFILLVCSVVAISISNSLYISLMERKSELGTLRSLGFPSSIVIKILLWENILLFFFSIIPGLVIAIILRTVVNNMMLRFEIPGLAGDLSFQLYFTPAYLALVITILFILVVSVTYFGSKKYLNRQILDLLGTSSC